MNVNALRRTWDPLAADEARSARSSDPDELLISSVNTVPTTVPTAPPGAPVVLLRRTLSCELGEVLGVKAGYFQPGCSPSTRDTAQRILGNQQRTGAARWKLNVVPDDITHGHAVASLALSVPWHSDSGVECAQEREETAGVVWPEDGTMMEDPLLADGRVATPTLAVPGRTLARDPWRSTPPRRPSSSSSSSSCSSSSPLPVPRGLRTGRGAARRRPARPPIPTVTAARARPEDLRRPGDLQAGHPAARVAAAEPGPGERAARAILYFVCLMYMFLGVSIIADRFMASIEVITSQERQVTITKPDGEKSVATVRVWNETVSNLTLMALGSSAPEILLSVIEVCGHNFLAGELGPGTIVGSAAFNMFVIIGVCVWVVPDGETRRIKHLRVFFITAFWSIFAYIWLYLILAVISPGVVDVWEALVTLFYFPVCVLLAWIADRRLLCCKYVRKRYRVDKRRGIVVETEGEGVAKGTDTMTSPENGLDGNHVGVTIESIKGRLDENRKEVTHRTSLSALQVIRILKELKKKHPEKELEQLIELANCHTLRHQPKSRAFYRVQATRRMIGAGNVLKKHNVEPIRRPPPPPAAPPQATAGCSHLAFEEAQYQCVENCGALSLHVVCHGGTGDNTFYLDYRTEDGSANAGADYEHSEGTLVFRPGDTRQEIKVGILDDGIFEEDEHFFVRLLNLRVGDGGPEERAQEGEEAAEPRGRLVDPAVATVTVLDDDHAGIFTFGQPLMCVSESVGTMEVAVVRNSGARGTVVLPYHTEDGVVLPYHNQRSTAHPARCPLLARPLRPCVCASSMICVRSETRKVTRASVSVSEEECVWLKRGISALLLNQDNPSAEEVEARRIAEMGKPILGEYSRLEVMIEESLEYKIIQGMSPNGILDQSTVDKLMQKTNLALVIGTQSWREQFVDAVTVSAGAGDLDDDEEQETPSCFDYAMHTLTVFWKILFACVPPSGYLNGWACFVVSIGVIGFLTAVIGDLASHFGCTVGLRDSVTAVVFVALGTSIPDTFASKVAATQDQYADASVGNVTGSNAVNVFLGIGVAWSVAAVYWKVKGETSRVDPGSLAFSVTLFTIFAFVSMGVLLFRRRPSIGGELGGPHGAKVLTTSLLFGLWLLYVLFSSLEAYCHIQGF
ncbi:hypothetical protein AAFF_G00216210 [Aldrovandia affinis]|uniref:Calx-beta domain-containing protein n=1 Tax=Aldrovandia affinis TaxID=143900 RepID=A0AAD7RGJ7_9TELE|nr:hypothetical protein AAFF_G00216210 [Aldrovandia affinis]